MATKNTLYSPLPSACHNHRHVLKPRKGHLVVMDRPPGMPSLSAGMMEMSYTKHYAASTHTSMSSSASSSTSDLNPSSPIDITFTATMSAVGSLLIGSSREFVDSKDVSSTQASAAVVRSIIERAQVMGCCG